jgi:Holliday junction resolvase YEN1
MFGCDLWIRDHRIPKDEGYDNRNKAHTKKAAKFVRVVRGDKLRQNHRLTREGCVLFALLAGGDYDSTGLVKCGAATALKAAQAGLGINLCRSNSQGDCNEWAKKLDIYFRKAKIPIVVPAKFPNFQTLQKYNHPKVLPDDELRRNAELKPDYRRKVNEIALLLVTSHRYNTWGQGYMEWVAPTLLTRDLADRNPAILPENIHGIQLVGKQNRKNNRSLEQIEQKITFSPFGLTNLLQPVFEGHMSGYWCGSSTKLFDPEYKVQCNIPTYLLREILPLGLSDRLAPAENARNPKRKIQDGKGSVAQSAPAEKKARKAHLSGAPSILRPFLGNRTDVVDLHNDEDLRAPGTHRSRLIAVPSAGLNTKSPFLNGDREVLEIDVEVPYHSIGSRTSEADKVAEHGDYNLQLALRVGMKDQRMTKSSKTASSQAPDVLDIIDLTDL